MRNKIITVFGSGFTRQDETYYAEAEEIGKILGKKRITVCNGGYSGIMEAVSKGAKSAGGKTIGITVEGWTAKPNKYLDEEVRMPNLMERITELITISDGYIVLKGGTGTLVELSLTLELMNKKAIPEKPIIIYKDFWKNVLETLKLDSEKLASLIDRNIQYFNEPVEINKLIQKI